MFSGAATKKLQRNRRSSSASKNECILTKKPVKNSKEHIMSGQEGSKARSMLSKMSMTTHGKSIAGCQQKGCRHDVVKFVLEKCLPMLTMPNFSFLEAWSSSSLLPQLILTILVLQTLNAIAASQKPMSAQTQGESDHACQSFSQMRPSIHPAKLSLAVAKTEVFMFEIR